MSRGTPSTPGWRKAELVHYPPNPYHRIDCRPTKRHLCVSINDTVLVDTEETVILFETALNPALRRSRIRAHRIAAALGDVELLQLQGLCDVLVLPDDVDDIAWSYPDPPPESLPIKGFLSFDAARVDVIAELPLTRRSWDAPA